MSTFKDLERMRAAEAAEIVRLIREDETRKYQKEYGSLARNAAVDVMTNGLGQTLAFWNSKPDKAPYIKIRTDLSNWIMKLKVDFFPDTGTENDLLAWIISEAGMAEYRWATREAVSFLTWLKRFVEAELSDEAVQSTERQGNQAAEEEFHGTPAATN